MGYRVFRDSKGTEWQTWDVVPQLAERRMSERRGRSDTPVELDLRSNDRRTSETPRSVVSVGLNTGWLCFEAAEEKRRLAPIPDDWQRCASARLQDYCARATPTKRVSIEGMIRGTQ